MIFGSNTTQLGDFSSKFAVDANYTASYGSALALVESAKTDYQMFRAMLNADAVEMGLKKNGGYLAESQIVSLQEATIKEIWNKIVEAFKRFGEKIKSLFTSAITKISSIFTNDEKLVKKYKSELLAKSKAINDISVKWIDMKIDDVIDQTTAGVETILALLTDTNIDYIEDADKRKDHFMLINGTFKNFDKVYNKEYMGNESPTAVDKKIADVGGISAICEYMEGHAKRTAKLKASMNSMLKKIEGIMKSYKALADGSKKIKNPNADEKEEAKIASHNYEMCQAGQTVSMKLNGWMFSTIKIYTKQNKAALLKAIAALGKAKKDSTEPTNTATIGEAAKLAEACGSEGKDDIFLYMIGECAEQEVDDVIDAAIPDSEIDELNSATTNVLDADTTDDPDKLTYDPDQYTPNLTTGISGTIDTNIDSKEESAFFGKLFY